MGRSVYLNDSPGGPRRSVAIEPDRVALVRDEGIGSWIAMTLGDDSPPLEPEADALKPLEARLHPGAARRYRG